VVNRPGLLHLGYSWPNLTLCEVTDRFPELVMQPTAEVAVHSSPSPAKRLLGGSEQVVHRQWSRPEQADLFMVLIFMGRINIATIFVRNTSC
jgi:hypothetical protein